MAPTDTTTIGTAKAAPAKAAQPDKSALVKALKDKRDELQKESADIRDVAAKIGRELTENEKKVLADNAADVATVDADVAALEKPAAATYDERIKELQGRRADVAEESRAIARAGRSRPLTDEERRTLQANETVVAEIDHAIGLIEREAFEDLPATDRLKQLQEERDDLAKADADAGTHRNDAAVARLDAEITRLKAEIAADEAAAKGAKP